LIAAWAASSTTPLTRTASSGVRWNTRTPWLASSVLHDRGGGHVVPSVFHVALERRWSARIAGHTTTQDVSSAVIARLDWPPPALLAEPRIPRLRSSAANVQPR
jgi:hypothetical protein